MLLGLMTTGAMLRLHTKHDYIFPFCMTQVSTSTIFFLVMVWRYGPNLT